MTHIINLPIKIEQIKRLRAGDTVYLNGDMWVMRDAAHKRYVDDLKNNAAVPDPMGKTIYYMAPCPAKAGEVIGSAGPTTSVRMDSYMPYLCERGLIATVGKGGRGEEAVRAIKGKGVYFCCIGGAGALYSDCITDVKTLLYEDLSVEALTEITVKDFPAVVGIDYFGNVLGK